MHSDFYFTDKKIFNDIALAYFISYIDAKIPFKLVISINSKWSFDLPTDFKNTFKNGVPIYFNENSFTGFVKNKDGSVTISLVNIGFENEEESRVTIYGKDILGLALREGPPLILRPNVLNDYDFWASNEDESIEVFADIIIDDIFQVREEYVQEVNRYQLNPAEYHKHIVDDIIEKRSPGV